MRNTLAAIRSICSKNPLTADFDMIQGNTALDWARPSYRIDRDTWPQIVSAQMRDTSSASDAAWLSTLIA